MKMTPEGRAQHSERMKALWTDPEYRARHAEALSKRPRHSVSLLPHPDSPEFRQYRTARDKLGSQAARRMFNIPPPKKARADRPSVPARKGLGIKGSFSGEAREVSPPPRPRYMTGDSLFTSEEIAERRRRFIERHG